MRLCKIKNCNEKHYAKEYCINHWRRFIWYPKNKKHSVEYQKQYRKEHYGIFVHICEIKNCTNRTHHKYKYCSIHRRRIEKNLPLDLSINCKGFNAPRGNRNFMWRGGVSEYPNHYLMKKNRIIVLKNNPKCKKCKKKIATMVHHKNLDKTDHRLLNLMPVCCSCNGKLRHHKNTSKYRRLYGMTLGEISKKNNCSTTQVWLLHKKNLLSILINKEF